MQIPNLPSYLQVPQQPNYNAVKIDVHNPMVNVPGQNPQYQTPVVTEAPQYAAPTMPYYNYPQGQLYSYPQAPVQPYYMPAGIPAPEAAPQVPVLVQPAITQTPQVGGFQEVPAAPQVIPPAPVITEAPKADEKNNTTAVSPEVNPGTVSEEQTVEIVPPAPVTPQIDLNSFIAKLADPDYEVQAAAMEEIANMINDEPQKATELLDTKIVDALTNIITADTSSLAGPTEAQEAARQKLFANQEMTDDEKNLAMTISPYEQAERNKSFAIFTSALMQKLFGDEVQKLTNSTVPLTELPGAVTIVEQLKNNPNAMVRTSAVEALSYLQNPSYKKDLNTVFTIAQRDQDKDVQEAATAALAKLNQLEEIPEQTQQAA